MKKSARHRIIVSCLSILLITASNLALAKPIKSCAASLVTATIPLLQPLESQFAEIYSTSGFGNEANLLQAIGKAGGEYVRALNLLKNEDFEITISAESWSRDAIATSKGIKAFGETKKSMGTVLSNRNLVESAFLHMDYQQYLTLPESEKPKYGYLAPKIGSGLKSPRGIYSYGQDRYILKHSSVKSRTTFSVGDSLNYLAPTVTARSVEVVIPMDTWSSYFIPWSSRAILSPLLAQGLAAEQRLALPIKVFGGTEGTVSVVASAYNQPIPLGDSSNGQFTMWTQPWNQMQKMPAGLKKYKCDHGWGLDYVEAQIWGPISLDDIAAFEFTTIPPQGFFLETLRAHKIEIRDGRTQPAKLWIP